VVRLERGFYERDTLMVARQLLGKELVRNSAEGITVGKIVETEAYIGPDDPASHAYRGRRTKRTEVQFGRGGYAYVYQVYGNHFCFNVVTQEIGMPEVVLVRALEPIEGISLMARRRRLFTVSEENMTNLTNGPAKLCVAMGIDKSLYGIDLCGETLFIVSSEPEPASESDIVATPRVNIEYAGYAKDYPWRFLVGHNRFVSKPLAR
jgi:DNA-3-methyladenine glycosylase